MKFVSPIAVTLLTACLVMACQSPKATSSQERGSLAPSTRNNSYSLLHQLLDQQKNISLLRLIKPERPDVKNVIKKIAAVSATGAKLLEEFAKHDPSIRLDDIQLPPGEVATRAAIAATTKKALVGQRREVSELALLLSQAEALNYARHLAKVGGENDSQPDRARALAGISEDMKNLYLEVFALLGQRAGT